MGDTSGSGDSQPATGRAYHHGNLQAALVAAGVELARAGGPDAIVLREVTRRVGVTPRAAYRHVADRDALVVEVARVALTEMATLIGTRIERLREDDPLERSAAALRAIGTGYIDYALAQPGLFATALFGLDDMLEARPTTTGATHASPYEALEQVLHGFVAVGALAAGEVPAAAAMCWSSVHGFATLATQGPLRELPRETASELGAGAVAMVVEGLVARGTGQRPAHRG